MRWHLQAFFLATAGTLTFFAGCGQSVYDARMAAAPDIIKKRGAGDGDKLLAKEYYTVFGVGDAGSDKRKLVKFKLPAAFMVDFARDLPAQEADVRFPVVDLEGNVFTRKTEIEDGAGKKRPAYCYFYTINKSKTPRADVEEKIKQGMTQLQATAAWQPAGKANLAQGSIMTVNGNFDFVATGGASENLAGQLVIYLFDTDERIVLIGWRSENKSALKANLASAIGKSMDSLLVESDAPAQPAPAPAP